MDSPHSDDASEDAIELRVQENISKWQSDVDPLAPLTEEQINLLYKTSDFIKDNLFCGVEQDSREDDEGIAEQHSKAASAQLVIDSNQDYIKWMVELEKEMQYDNLDKYLLYYDKIREQSLECELLLAKATETVDTVEELKNKYHQVTTKTDSLHNLSEQLTKQQKILKDKKKSIKEKLHYFVTYNALFNTVHRYANHVNTKEYVEILNKIDSALEYLNSHQEYKESKIYKIKYESLLTIALLNVSTYVNKIITQATKQITDPDAKSNLLDTTNTNEPSFEAFTLFYGRFQSAAVKTQAIISHVEEKIELHSLYINTVQECQKTYFSQRFPVMSVAVSKALLELRDKHKQDHSVLFRSSGTFVMKVCQDEATCFYYFFKKTSELLNNYLGALCQHLYDILRPSLIAINHLEVLTELCGILQKEMLSEQAQVNPSLEKFVEIMRQLLEDVEERLVFRTHVFFQNDLSAYQPSAGDLAYPEKLEQMEIIAAELNERRTGSHSSLASIESQEVAAINANQLGQFRSHTGNSPADLHGMWYPTVKRTLVCLSRLYFCLDRETFQGLAQEALAICLKTVEYAASLISARKTQIDGRLFQIKHLLIIREQIAPFQVDFTVKEMSLDFSSIKSAAVGLIHNRDKLFSFNSNNALLEFLLEGTPKVKEYLVDSRKEIDKQLKISCEAFIAHCTEILVGNMLHWIKKAETFLKSIDSQETTIKEFHEQKDAKPSVLTGIISSTQRHIKSKIPEIQKFMQLYLANRETEFILFRPIKNNVINAFIQLEQIISTAKYSNDDRLMIACPSPEQVNVLVCSVALTTEQDASSDYFSQRKISQSSSTK